MKRIVILITIVTMLITTTLCVHAEGLDFSKIDTETLKYMQGLIEAELASRENSETEVISSAEKYTNAAYTYILKDDGTVSLIDYSWADHVNGNDLRVPATIDGYAVTEIAANCFAKHDDHTRIATLVIPEGIETIGRLAFYDITINHISVPKSVVNIDEGAFASMFTTISVDKNNSFYTAVGNGLYHKPSKSLIALAHEDASILDGITRIGAYACYMVEGDEENQYLIPSTVMQIGDHAFYMAELWTHEDNQRNIPAVDIGESAFEHVEFVFFNDYHSSYPDNMCITLSNALEVIPAACFRDASCSAYASEKYFSSRTFDYEWRKIHDPKPLQIALPESLRVIDESAFANNSTYNDGEVNLVGGLPKHLENIGNSAFSMLKIVRLDTTNLFSDMDSLRSIGDSAFEKVTIVADNRETDIITITVPSTVTSIGAHALSFKNAVAHTIYLPESVVAIGEDAFNKSNATLHISEGSYAANWAVQNAFRYTGGGVDDLSWLNN